MCATTLIEYPLRNRIGQTPVSSFCLFCHPISSPFLLLPTSPHPHQFSVVESLLVMTSALQEILGTRNPSFARRAVTPTQPPDDPPSRQVQYRLLVSRAVTQRLHSPSLAEAPSSAVNTVEEWEKQDRRFAKANVEAGARLLGVSWRRSTDFMSLSRLPNKL